MKKSIIERKLFFFFFFFFNFELRSWTVGDLNFIFYDEIDFLFAMNRFKIIIGLLKLLFFLLKLLKLLLIIQNTNLKSKFLI